MADEDKQVSGDAPAADCWSPATKSPCATETQTEPEVESSGMAERFASLGALLSAAIASSWCWLPPLLILGGVSGAGMMTIVEQYRPLFMIVTFGLLGAAFYMAYRPNAKVAGGNSRMMVFNKIMLWTVTVMAVVMLANPQAVSGLFAMDSQFTADMERTVFRVEGMTWPTWAPKAEKAIETAPGVLAVKVDYESKLATVGTEAGIPVQTDEILTAIKSLGYQAELYEPLP